MFGLVCVLLASIISGSKIVFSNLNNFFNDMKFVKPSFIHLVPEMVKFLLKRIQALGLQEATGGNLKKIMCGGAQIDKNTVEDYKNFGITVSGCYGITECSPCISINALQKNKNGTAGIALPCNKIKIADNNQEILVKGDNVMIGYYENEELTKQVITDGWFHTGDIGFIEDGFLTVTGRIKNLIVLESGKKINPEEIENMFLGCSEINEIIVYEYKNQIHAKIFSKNFIKNEIQKIIDQVNSKLPMYKRINKFELSDVPLEKTSINKIKRRKSNYES
jgi:long-chain acyl-CoA synthetase